jgi:tetratricopeptide (TPR) repeat protein
MRVRTHLRLWRVSRALTPLALGACAGMVAGLFFGGELSLVIAIGTLVGSSSLHPRLEGWARQQLLLSKNSEITAASHPRAIYEDICDGYRRLRLAHDNYLHLLGAYVLLRELRWKEARAELAAIPPATLETPGDRMMYEGYLAWALLHDGAAEEAVARAEKAAAIGASMVLAAEHRASLDGTLGAALAAAGRPTAALPLLERAVPADAMPEDHAARHFHLGCALAALKRTEEARRHWEEAERSETPWARPAREKLKETPGVYR